MQYSFNFHWECEHSFYFLVLTLFHYRKVIIVFVWASFQGIECPPMSHYLTRMPILGIDGVNPCFAADVDFPQKALSWVLVAVSTGKCAYLLSITKSVCIAIGVFFGHTNNLIFWSVLVLFITIIIIIIIGQPKLMLWEVNFHFLAIVELSKFFSFLLVSTF